ncbi:hypothetical protein [Azotosporobacter soli]|uniref:hypothetical protein n=1 Tax=Azotosporobacter soli TaxID=3055040 RepID=UPI0031FEAB74
MGEYQGSILATLELLGLFIILWGISVYLWEKIISPRVCKIRDAMIMKFVQIMRKNRWGRWSVVATEGIFFALLIAIICKRNSWDWLFVLLIIILSIVTPLSYKLRMEIERGFSLIKQLQKTFNRHEYIGTRVTLLFEAMMSGIACVGIPQYLTLVILKLDWPDFMQMTLLVSYAVYSNLWIYMKMPLVFQDKKNVENARKFLTYIIVLLFVLQQFENKFYALKEGGPPDVQGVVYVIVGVVFFAFERVIKTMADDYAEYQKHCQKA